ncbi:MAG: tetratricopeptide repeat protein [Deltaproteobacteria bacterium]|nr:tetratricopeptide repeat protein [Deltaproteobacteria bacterium]
MFLFLLSASLTRSLTATETLSPFQKAEILFNKKQYAAALTLYENAALAAPHDIIPYRRIIQCAKALDDSQAAVIIMESLYLEHPEHAEICYGLGYAQYETENYDMAVTYFERALKINPELAAAWNNCAAIFHFITRDFVRARTYYKNAITLSQKSGDERVLSIATKNLANLPKPQETEPLYTPLSLEEFINRFIADAEADNSRSLSLLVAGQKENCLPALEWLLQEAMRSFAAGGTEDEKTALLLAALLEQYYRAQFQSNLLQQQIDTYATLGAAAKKHIVRGDGLMEKATVHEQQGNLQQARQTLNEALSCYTQVPDQHRAGLAHLALGDMERRFKHYKTAEKHYSNAVTGFIASRSETNKALALSSLGMASSLMGNNHDALDFFERALRIYRQINDEASAAAVQKNIGLLKSKTR